MARGHTAGDRQVSGTALALVLTAARPPRHLEPRGQGRRRRGPGRVHLALHRRDARAAGCPIGVVWVVGTGERPTWCVAWSGRWCRHSLHVGLPARPAARVRRGRPQPGVSRSPAAPARCSPSWSPSSCSASIRARWRGRGRARRRRRRPADLARRPGARSDRRRATGVVWGLATGATIASYTLWDNHSVNALDVPPVPYFVLGPVLQLPFLAVLMRRRRDPTPIREVWRATRAPALVVATAAHRWPTSWCSGRCSSPRSPSSPPARESSIVIGAVVRLAGAARAAPGPAAGRRGRRAGGHRADRGRLIPRPAGLTGWRAWRDCCSPPGPAAGWGCRRRWSPTTAGRGWCAASAPARRRVPTGDGGARRRGRAGAAHCSPASTCTSSSPTTGPRGWAPRCAPACGRSPALPTTGRWSRWSTSPTWCPRWSPG